MLQALEARRSAVELPEEVLGQIKVKVKKLERFDELWRSSGIATKHKVSACFINLITCFITLIACFIGGARASPRSTRPRPEPPHAQTRASPCALPVRRCPAHATLHLCARSQASIWEDRAKGGAAGGATRLTQRNRLRVALGHFASGSYAPPRADRYTLELTDLSVSGVKRSEWLPRVLRFCFPHPVRFHQVWGIQTGAAPLFVWEPVPPSAEYVALGMVASQSEEPPPVREVHCVPRGWVEPAPELTKMLWSDAGASGKPGSLWAAGSLNLLVAAGGHEAPAAKAWRLVRTRFTLGDHLGAGAPGASAHAAAGGGGAALDGGGGATMSDEEAP